MSGTTKITAESSIKQLPTDVSTLQQMVLTLLGQIDDLQGQLHYLKRQLFGKKSEKLDPAQRLLFENLYNEVQAKIEEQKQQPKPQSVQKKKKNENRKNCKKMELFGVKVCFYQTLVINTREKYLGRREGPISFACQLTIFWQEGSQELR